MGVCERIRLGGLTYLLMINVWKTSWEEKKRKEVMRNTGFFETTGKSTQ